MLTQETLYHYVTMLTKNSFRVFLRGKKEKLLPGLRLFWLLRLKLAFRGAFHEAHSFESFIFLEKVKPSFTEGYSIKTKFCLEEWAGVGCLGWPEFSSSIFNALFNQIQEVH